MSVAAFAFWKSCIALFIVLPLFLSEKHTSCYRKQLQLIPQQCPTRPGHLPSAHHRPAVRRSECTFLSYYSQLKYCLLAQPHYRLSQGFLEQTYLFYGYYKVDKIHFPNFTYNLPLAYLLVTIAYLFLSLVWIVKRYLKVNWWRCWWFCVSMAASDWTLLPCRSATGFKRNLVQDEDRFQSFCNKVFAGWDFCITNENAAKLKRSSLLYELRVSASSLYHSKSSDSSLLFICLRAGLIKLYLAGLFRQIWRKRGSNRKLPTAPARTSAASTWSASSSTFLS